MGKHDSEINILKQNIEKLQLAKAKMIVGGNDIDDVNTSLRSIKSSISYNRWKGERRNDFDYIYSMFMDKSSLLISFNNENIVIINKKIEELKNKISNLRMDNDD